MHDLISHAPDLGANARLTPSSRLSGDSLICPSRLIVTLFSVRNIEPGGFRETVGMCLFAWFISHDGQ